MYRIQGEDEIQEANGLPRRWSWDVEPSVPEMSRAGEAVPQQHPSIDDVESDPGPINAGSAAGEGGSENVPEENNPGDDNREGADAGEAEAGEAEAGRANPGENAPSEAVSGEVDPVEEGSSENDLNEGEPGDDSASDIPPGKREQKLCVLCMCPMGRRRPMDNNIETRVYLPCGHSFGHVCLFGQIFAKEIFDICPLKHCLSTLRHSCGHLPIPTLEKPDILIRSKTADRLPVGCAYCSDGVGLMRQEIRESRIQQYRKALISVRASSILWKPCAILKRKAVQNQILFMNKQLRVGHSIATLNAWDECQRIAKQGEAHVLGLLAGNGLGQSASRWAQPNELVATDVDFNWTLQQMKQHASMRRARSWKTWDLFFWRTGNS